MALLSTGNEIVDLQSPQPRSDGGWGGIWDTNRPSLSAALQGMGYDVLDLGVVPDELSFGFQPKITYKAHTFDQRTGPRQCYPERSRKC